MKNEMLRQMMLIHTCTSPRNILQVVVITVIPLINGLRMVYQCTCESNKLKKVNIYKVVDIFVKQFAFHSRTITVNAFT